MEVQYLEALVTDSQQPIRKKCDDGKKRKQDDTAGENAGEEDKIKLPPIDYDISEDAMELDDTGATAPGAQEGEKQNTLTAATGGGFGYDLDAAPTIALWGAGSATPPSGIKS